LELAEAMTALPADVPDALFARLRHHFDEAQLVELVATAALENFRARFNRAFRIEPNSFYCPLPGHGAPSAPDVEQS
jgi:alkylhydroperoxidase family enzyme